ncbi:MAG TPA: ubiquinol-cytochrome c reductase iron-sulfur subunit [Halobacteriales archaeon]|nr:ubiquinol-cytochrome c reductase iron-sulfur subunit [Halobacteriales archaeon]
MSESDKYPESSGRRRFVKGVVGSASLAGVGASTSAMINTTTNPSGGGGGITQFFGIERTDGPAPRGMPMIPVRIDDEGFLQGHFPEWETVTEQGLELQVAREEIGGIEYGAQWFQYCGVQTYPGLQPDADQDNYFRYADNPPYQWQSDEVSAGDQVNVSDFEDFESWGNDIGQAGIGKPAMVTWRSQDVGGSGTMPVQVLRIPPDDFEQVTSDSQEWLDAASEQNFIAWLDKCTHFCCVPTFKGTEQSAQFDAENDVYCPCHQSVYDPYSIVGGSYVALPRPEAD